MKKQVGLAIVLWCAALANLASADQAADEAAIRQSAADYVTAFNGHDAPRMAEFWTETAVYHNPVTGDAVSGREEIAQELAAVFEALKDAKLTVNTTSVEFVSPLVAVERGTAQVVSADSEPEITEYSAVHVKQGDKWLIDRLTEHETVEVPSHYEQLKPLEWMIGSWVDEDDHARVETTCQWAKNNNFITRSFTIDMVGQPALSGVQFIGWDAAAGTIRSWAFDSDGGVTEGTWSNKDGSWIVESSAILPDGRKASSINIMKALDADNLSWQITGRDVDGEILPNLPEVKITRSKAQD